MNSGKKISLCLTNFNREDFVIEAYSKIVDDDRVSEVIISDDHSNIDIYNRLKEKIGGHPKVKLLRNDENMGVYRNKFVSVACAQNDWVIVGDSDNVYPIEFINKLYDTNWQENTILAPDFAKPVFDYDEYSGSVISKENIRQFVDLKKFDCLMNTMNYFVNRNKYVEIWDNTFEPIGADSIYQNYNWIKAGYKMYVVPGLQYDHRVHYESHFRNNAIESTPIIQDIINKMKGLR